MNWTGYTTRKVVLGALASIVLVCAWVATQWLSKAAEHYGTLAMGLTGLYATFCGVNALQDHIFTRNGNGKAHAALVPGPDPIPPVEPLPEA